MNNQDEYDPHVCLLTLDGKIHVIPFEVFDRIIIGDLKITAIDDWEMIVRSVFSEWAAYLKRKSILTNIFN